MNLNVDSFWDLVADSQLLNGAQIDALRTQWPDQSPQTISEQLEKEKIISPLQREVLLAGRPGPFRYGRYLVLEKLEHPNETAKGQGPNSFAATAFAGRDLRTQHPVKLDFYNGQSATAVAQWQAIEQRVRSLSECRHPNLLETFQTISLPEFRFVVSEMPTAKKLSGKLGHKVRLKLDEAAPLTLQVALAIQSMIDAGVDPMLPPADQMPERIWLGKKATYKLEPTWQQIPDAIKQSPQRVVVSLLLRIAGNDYGHPDNLSTPIEKAGITGELEQIVRNTFKTSGNEPTEHGNSGDLKDLINALEAISPKVSKPAADPTLMAFRRVLDSAELALEKTEVVKDVPAIDPDVLPSEMGDAETGIDPRVLAAREAADLRRKGRWKVPAAIAATLLAMVTAGIIWTTSIENQVATGPNQPAPAAPNNGGDDSTTPDPTSPNSPSASTTGSTPEIDKPDYSNVAYVQEILDDDSSRLWQSPTFGTAIDFRYVPALTEILLHARPGDLIQSGAGTRLLNGFKNTFAQSMQTMQQRIGVAPEKISEITISLYPGESRNYNAIYRVEVTKDVSLIELTAAWGNPDEVKTREGQTIYSADDAVYLITSSESEPLSFVVGEPKLIQEMAAQGGVSVLSRPLQRLAERSDRNRHLTLLASPKSLTDRYGQALWGETADIIVPQLRLFFPDEVEGFAMGLHSDDGEYLELQVDHTRDVTPEEMQQTLKKKLRSAFLNAGVFAESLPGIAYWDSMRKRISPIMGQVTEQVRWGVESQNVISNAWLPPDAAQNLIAASELTLAFAKSANSRDAGAPKSPQNLMELLATKRSLNIANPPDLNILLSQFASNVSDDFPSMSFEFKISLKGNDLQKEGITQNQRPSALVFENTSVADILTEIMVGANPDKNISGPADANCKLVWVVVKDENTGTSSIAITTRAAAKARGAALPPAFVVKP